MRLTDLWKRATRHPGRDELPATLTLLGARTGKWSLAVTGSETGTSIHLTSPDGHQVHGDGDDTWSAMRALRLQLEEDGCLLQCNGARIDAHPSHMALDMGGGGTVYLLRPGHPASPKDLVDIFGPAPAGRIGTVAAQDEFYEGWLASL